MSGTSRRGLLKGALAGGVSLVGAQSALGHPPAEAKGETDATPLAGTPGRMGDCLGPARFSSTSPILTRILAAKMD